MWLYVEFFGVDVWGEVEMEGYCSSLGNSRDRFEVR